MHELFNLATGSGCTCNGISCKLCDLIFGLLPPQILWRQPEIPCRKIHHVFHFYYLCMVPHPGSMRQAGKSPSLKNTKYDGKVTLGGIEQDKNTKARHYSAERDKPLAIPSVTELHEADVRFKRKRKPRHLFDITFEDGVMEIPELYIDDLHCVLLANLLAFEQTSYGLREIVQRGPVDLGIVVGLSEIEGRKKEGEDKGRREGQPVLIERGTDKGANTEGGAGISVESDKGV